MGCIISFGVLSLPQVLARCGLVPGVLAILAFGGLNSFWAHRLIELPMLVRSNLERYGDIAKVCFPHLHGIAFLSLIATWYGLALLSYYCALYYSRHHVAMRNYPPVGYGMEVGFCLIMTFMSFRSSVKENQKRCIWGMYVVLAFVTLSCIAHGVANYDTNTYHWFGRDWAEIADGMMKVGLAYTGLGILPYVVSEMLNPGNARKVANRAVNNITAYYVCFALVGYFGFGDSIDDSVAREIERLADHHIFYRVTSTIITIMLMGKFLLIYPILFLPLLRELEGFLELDESPPILLGLPWAIERLRRTKVVIRIIPTFGSLLVYQFCNNFSLVSAVCMIPFFLTQMILPSVLTLRAMGLWHRPQQPIRISRNRTTKDVALFGVKMWQVMVTGVLAVISICVGLMAILESIHTVANVRIEDIYLSPKVHSRNQVGHKHPI